MKYDLAVIIPGRNEQFISRTVDSVLKAIRGNTQIIVGLDESWAEPGIADHDRVTLIHSAVSLGQRGMTNQCVRLSKATLIMKLDAHCIVSDGFDLALMEAHKKFGDTVVQIPTLYNLHAFDLVCPKCQFRKYQGPEPVKCEKCGTELKREMIWKPRLSRKSEFYRFDTTLHFQYHSDRKKKVPSNEMYPETMSAQGSCFIVSTKKYWELNLGDENYGSWGAQGSQIACSTWLSGMRLITNRNCWYSHMFRTQGQSFGFPYPLSGKQVDHARKFSQDLFFNNKYEKQIYPLSWLIAKFAPLPDWHEEKGKAVLDMVNKKGEEFYQLHKPMKKGIIYFTDNQLNLHIAHGVQRQLNKIGLPIVSSSLKPMSFGKNIVTHAERGYLTMFRQILSALEASDADIVYFCEHDVFYHKSHLDFTPPDENTWCYNQNWVKIREDGTAASWQADQVSGICVYRKLAIDFYKKRIETFLAGKFDRKFEPMSGSGSIVWRSKYPNIDIRHGKNLTYSKWKLEDFRDKNTAKGFRVFTIKDIEGWDFSKGWLKPLAL